MLSELEDLQKFGVTGEFFLLRQYVAKCRLQFGNKQKYTPEFVAGIIAQKMVSVKMLRIGNT